jgi:membrane-bound lytic murein transglycosylase D
MLQKIIFLLFLLLSSCFQTNNKPDERIIQPTPTPTPKNTPISTPKITQNYDSDDNLWRYIANRSSLKARNSQDIFWHLDWFKKHPDYLTRVTKRAKPYLHWIVQEVEKQGVPLEIALLPIVESAYYPFSFSHGTASGLWQFIPSTGKLYGLKQNYWVDERRSIIRSSRAAISYLKSLNKLFKGNWLLAIASYNSGPGRVLRAIEKNKKLGLPTDFWHISLPSETRGYVPRLLAVAELIKHPKKYAQNITFVKNEPLQNSVIINSQLDLSLVSDWTGLTLEKIYELNPDLNRFATPNTKHYPLLLPINKIDNFKQKLTHYPRKKRLIYQRYLVKSGDSLSKIAHQFDTSKAYIKSINNIKKSHIKIGQTLTIPVPAKSSDYYLLSQTQRKAQRLGSKRNGTKIIHIVKKGDSLWSIARKYDSHTKNIISWNHLEDGVNALKIGEKLRIYQVKKPKAKTLSQLSNVTHGIKRTITHTVKPGQSLSIIAQKFNVSAQDIAKDNQLGLNKILKIGQILKIKVDITQ